jgi:hypothetical protein
MNKYYDYQRAVVLPVKELIKQIAEKIDGLTFYEECVKPESKYGDYAGFVFRLVETWRKFCSQEFFEVNYSTDYVLAVKDDLDDAESIVFVCSKETVKKPEEVA